MCLQNRVDPWGDIHAVPDRGGWMGNRGGRIHRPDQTLGTRRWASKQWIYCVLEFRGRSRKVMGARTYTELFFMDEVTALSAGHRPCWECQNKRAKEFLAAAGGYRALEIDEVAHEQRTGARERSVVKELPDGVMFGYENHALTKWGGQTLVWSWRGFAPFLEEVNGQVEVITPGTYIQAIKKGFVPTLKLRIP